MNKDYYTYTHFSPKLFGKKSSVHKPDSFRIIEANTQLTLTDKVPTKNEIINLTKDFLFNSGYWNKCDNLQPLILENPKIIFPKRKSLNKRIVDIDYSLIKDQYKLNSEKHIIWMKFTTDGYLGVVARSNDINFEIPPKDESDESEINKYISSGIILHHLKKDWNEKYVLVFPIPNVGDYEMSDIECGIGQYLIKNNVPILDRYSHTFM